MGKVTEQKLHSLGIRKVGDLAKFGDADLEEQFGKWGVALAGKARGEDAGAWFEGEIGADEGAKSISHEHTYDQDTANVAQLESTLMRLSEMVGRRIARTAVARQNSTAEIALQRFHHHHPRALARFADAARQRNLPADPTVVSYQLA